MHCSSSNHTNNIVRDSAIPHLLHFIPFGSINLLFNFVSSKNLNKWSIRFQIKLLLNKYIRAYNNTVLSICSVCACMQATMTASINASRPQRWWWWGLLPIARVGWTWEANTSGPPEVDQHTGVDHMFIIVVSLPPTEDTQLLNFYVGHTYFYPNTYKPFVFFFSEVEQNPIRPKLHYPCGVDPTEISDSTTSPA